MKSTRRMRSSRHFEWFIAVLLMFSILANDFKQHWPSIIEPQIFDYFLFLVVGFAIGYYVRKEVKFHDIK
jgi:hypothetical protein